MHHPLLLGCLHFRALKIVDRDNVSTFDELLQKDNSVRVHHRNIQFLAIEMFEVELGIAPSFMNDIFQKRLVSKECPYVHSGPNPSFIIIIILELSRTELKQQDGWDQNYGTFCRAVSTLPATLKVFIENVKKWIPTNCRCRLCNPFQCRLRFRLTS